MVIEYTSDKLQASRLKNIVERKSNKHQAASLTSIVSWDNIGYNRKENSMTTKEAINILNHAVEYYDMNYNTGDKRDTTFEISKAWKALNHVASELTKEKEDEKNNR